MSKKIVEINFRYTVSTAEMQAGVETLVDQVANVPGLIWKIWILDEAEQQTGGIYYFEDEEDARAYLSGPVFEQVKSSPILTDFRVKMYDVMDAPSLGTRAPL